LFSKQRSDLVEKYRNKLGQDYLLDVLEPGFRIDSKNNHS
jgi:hypothetical protein